MLNHHHRDVVNFEIVRQSDDRPVFGGERLWLVVEHPIADVLYAGFGQIVERIVGFG